MTEWFTGFTLTWRRICTDGGVLLLLVGAIAIYSMFYPLPSAWSISIAPASVANSCAGSMPTRMSR